MMYVYLQLFHFAVEKLKNLEVGEMIICYYHRFLEFWTPPISFSVVMLDNLLIMTCCLIRQIMKISFAHS